MLTIQPLPGLTHVLTGLLRALAAEADTGAEQLLAPYLKGVEE